MIAWIAALLLVITCVGLLQALQLTTQGHSVLSVALDSLELLSASELTDQEKESGLQKNSLKLFSLFFRLVAGFAIALAIPIGLLWVADQIGVVSFEAVIAVTLSPLFLIISTLLIVLWLIFKGRLSKDESEEINQYSTLDQALHRMSFKTFETQVSVANFEDNAFAKKLSGFQVDRPVFITALPRAGTTLLLECLADVPEFATHCYRDMPFVLIPCFWNRYSRLFQREVSSQERAHGDGMQISPDSPEALEEVIWTVFWKRHYKRDRIIPWGLEKNSKFSEFFSSHMRKIMYLRRQKPESSTRYVSKNNANISRIDTLKYLFPNSTIVVPFRNPFHHAASLLQQHLNFLKIHKTDEFASEYMSAIGHYDFGENLRPIDFDNWLDTRASSSAKDMNFWLEYWLASYQYLLGKHRDNVSFLNYDALCEDPEQGLEKLAKTIDSCNPGNIRQQSKLIGKPRPKSIDTTQVPSHLSLKINDVYAQLQTISIN